MQVLKEVSSMKVSIPTSVDPKEFFKKREGLYIYENANMEKLLEIAEPVCGDFDIEFLELIVDSSDENIEKSLENKNTFSENDACAIIAELISKQPKGEEGTLVNNGYANIFYTPACVVGVSWFSGYGYWSVDAWERGGSEWNAGIRVFSPQLTLGN